MNMLTVQHKIFQKSSTTYFYSSSFFPPRIRREVSVLYAFVRLVDDTVDSVPQDALGFQALREAYRSALGGIPSGNAVVDDFVVLKKERRFEDAWVEAFLGAMAADLHVQEYDHEPALMKYVHGSAEVIGLFLCSILGLPPEARFAAAMQGRAMQYINFIRDINEDIGLGRRYLPLAESGLAELSESAAYENKTAFARFISGHLERFRAFQRLADAGYRYIPYRYRVAIRTARDMYEWTGQVIERNPLVVFERKVKPRKTRVILTALRNAFVELFRMA